MAKTDEKVMQMVEKELDKNPDISVSELFEKAKKINADIGKLSNRQFHARYPLQIKRRKAMESDGSGSGGSKRKKPAKKAKPKAKAKAKAAPKKAAKAAPTGAQREAIRKEFLSFASDLTGAEARKDLVKVLASVDRYVDRVVKATAK